MTAFKTLCCDAFEALEALDEPIAAMVTDPPYASGGFSEAAKLKARGQGLRSETLQEKGWFSGDQMSTDALAWLLRELAWRFAEKSRDGSTLTMFCDWRMISALAPAVGSAGLRLQNLLVWDKRTPGLGTGFRMQHECALHFAKGTPAYASARFGNVIGAPRMPADRQHPTEKPVALMRAIVETVADRGALVVDPFMGSGSTGVAALECGRRFFGADRDPAFVQIANERLAAAQPRLRFAERAQDETRDLLAAPPAGLE